MRDLGVARGSVVLAVARAIARIPALVLPLVIGAIYGASSQTDCFFAVYALVLFAATAAGSALENAVVPFLRSVPSEADRRLFLGAVAHAVLRWGGGVSIALLFMGLAWSVLPTVTPEGWESGWLYLLMFSAVPPAYAITSLMNGALNAAERFNQAAMIGGLRGAIAVGLGFVLSDTLGLTAFAVGILTGEVIAAAWVHRLAGGVAFKASGQRDVVQFFAFVRQILKGAIANSSKSFVDRMCAALVAPGGVSLLEYAERAFMVLVSVLGAPFATVALTKWTNTFAGKADAAVLLLRAVRRAWYWWGILAVALIGVYYATADLIVASADRRLSPDDVDTFRQTLDFYMWGLVPYFASLAASQAILVMRDGRFIVRTAVLIAVLNLCLDLLGIWLIGLPGIALTSTVLYGASWGLAADRLRRHADAVKQPA